MSSKMRMYGILLIVLVVIGGVMAAGFWRSPEARKGRHLARADGYFSRQQYREAIIEYRNVLQVEKANGRAIRQLGLAHYELGELGHALRYLPKSRELDPGNLDIRLRLGTIYLVAGQPQKAREEAAFVLEKDPKRLEALGLLAGAAKTPQDIDDTTRRLEKVRADFEDRAKFHLMLGSLSLRKRDVAGAERAFKEAVAREPRSIEPHTVLGDFYVAKGDPVRAEGEYTAAADLAPMGSPARIKLIDFYLFVRKPEEAKRLLAEITGKLPDYLPAWRRLGEIAFAEGKYDESVKAVEVILKKRPADLEAHLLRGRIHLAKRETTEAIEEFRKVLKLEPRLTRARYQLALAQLQAGNLQSARGELREAATIDPTFTEVTLL